MNMKKESGSIVLIVMALVVVVALLSVTVYVIGQDSDENNENQQQTTAVSDGSEAEPSNQTDADVIVEYTNNAQLDDVTNNETIEGVLFDGTQSGVAGSAVLNDQYILLARFENLPELSDDYFYEGWVVGGENGVVSTGELVIEEGIYFDRYTGDASLIDSKRYVLTLEPRDGNPAPADHIVEGDFSTI
jgi:hypothetical protein